MKTGPLLKNLQTSIFIVLLLFANTGVQARHLVGGSLSYTYLGKQTDGTYKYDISIEIYRDCTQQVSFDGEIYVGFYDWGSDSLVTTLTIDSQGEMFIPQQYNRPGCNFNTSGCLSKMVYHDTINLPASNYGYYAEYQRCCRNTNINLEESMGQQLQGQTFFGIIPPTNIVNSSPYFINDPSLFVCVDGTDTASISNFAIDPDGDSLVYGLAWPYDGLNSSMPSYTDSSQLPHKFSQPGPVVYNSGYSFSHPFGSGGYAHIDSLTGVTNLFIKNAGIYVIAFDVYEYRKGQLLSRTRRDLEIIAVNCPGSSAPVRLPVNGLRQAGYQSTFSVQAGDTVSFDIDYKSKDSLELTYSGDMFNHSGGVKPPYASLDTISTFSRTIIYDHFFWHTSCAQVRPAPYVFVVAVTDNGCPPKTTYQGYSIYVDSPCVILNIQSAPTNYSTIQIYPNPTTTTLSIESATNPITSVSVFDMIGREVYPNFSEVSNTGKIIDVSNLPAGMYIVKLGMDEGSFVGKFIKK